jgi:predicted nucleic acid-binding protein
VRYLFDASALLTLVTSLGRKLILKASEDWLATTDLAICETCNALWKLSTLLRSISSEDGIETGAILRELTERQVIHLVDVTKLRLQDTLRLAYDERLTFYDASYVMAAKDQSAILITQDEKLTQAAQRHVTVVDFRILEDKFERR